jgi:prepilin-type N-terminal cleavage/methylation domain-containing protein
MGSRLHQDERGFTLIELLVVLFILTILASIGISMFINQRAKAQDAEAKTSASLVASTLQVYHQDNDTFVGADRNALILIEPAIAGVRGLQLNVGLNTFEVQVASVSGASGGGPYRVEYDTGRAVRRCLQPGLGGCPDTGFW